MLGLSEPRAREASAVEWLRIVEGASLWQQDIGEVTGHNLEARGREQVNRLLQEGWRLLHIYTLKYQEAGVWRERPMAILGKAREGPKGNKNVKPCGKRLQAGRQTDQLPGGRFLDDRPLPLNEHRLAWLLTDIPKEVNRVPSRCRNGELIMPVGIRRDGTQVVGARFQSFGSSAINRSGRKESGASIVVK